MDIIGCRGFVSYHNRPTTNLTGSEDTLVHRTMFLNKYPEGVKYYIEMTSMRHCYIIRILCESGADPGFKKRGGPIYFM